MKIILLFFLLITSGFSLSQSEKDTVVFSHASGVYKDSIYLVLSNLNSDKIYYSDNGDYPKTEYKEPILLKKSTSIRVKNRKTLKGYTRNYIFPNRKILLPIVCLTIKPSDLYDSATGIYVKGPNASDIPPYLGANFHKNWERTAYIEFIDTNNLIGFNQKIGIKIFGQFSSMLPQKSFSIHARKKYGKGKIKYNLFPKLPFKKYKSFILRNSGSDYCYTHFRDVMMTSLVKDFNIETQDYRSCIVYINGEYWGIYHIREKINEHFLKQHFKVDKDSVAIMKHRMDVQHYGRLNYKNILKFIKNTDFTIDSNINELSKLIDIDNYLDYNIAQVYFSNIDAGGNIRYWRERKEGAKWRWILFDTDFGFGLRKGNGVEENTVKRFTEYSSEKWPFPGWSTLIIRKLLENDSIQQLYLRKFSHYLNTTFCSSSVISHIDKIENSLELEIPYHFNRWNRKPENWKKNVDFLKDFAKRRPNYLYKYLKQRFDIDSSYNLIVAYDTNQGSVFIDNFKIYKKDTNRFFTSVKYNLKALPKFGYQFSHWSKGNTVQEIDFVITKDTVLNAFFVKNDDSKLKGLIYINELGKGDSLLSNYIEIFNSSDSSIDISNWILICGDSSFVVEDGTHIESNSYYTFLGTHNSIKNSQLGLFSFEENETIKLFTNEEEFVDSVFLKKKIFKKTNKMEFVNTSVKREWVSSDENSINKINSKHQACIDNNQKIIITFISIVSIMIFTSIFLFFRKRKHRSEN